MAAVALALLILFLSFIIYNKASHRKYVTEKTKRLQALKLKTISGTDYTLPTGKQLLIILFNTTCEHCMAEAKALSKTIHSFEDATIVMVSTESLEEIRNFSRDYDLNNYTNVFFTSIDDTELYNAFGTVNYPEIFIYSSDGDLVKQFKGETKPEAILKYISK